MSSNLLHICMCDLKKKHFNSNKLLEQNLCKHSSNTHFVCELLFGLDFKSVPKIVFKNSYRLIRKPMTLTTMNTKQREKTTAIITFSEKSKTRV